MFGEIKEKKRKEKEETEATAPVIKRH